MYKDNLLNPVKDEFAKKSIEGAIKKCMKKDDGSLKFVYDLAVLNSMRDSYEEEKELK